MKSWSSTQGSVATSVAEAEYYAVLKGAAEAFGFASLSSSGVIRQQQEVWQPEKD